MGDAPVSGADAGRVFVVTGASRGIGEACARALAAPGSTVVLTARSTKAIEALASELQIDGVKAVAFAMDVRSEANRAELFQMLERRFGRVDALINNAGILPRAARAEDMSHSEWQAAFDTNVSGAFLMACGLKPLLGRGSVVVNIASTAAFYPSIGLTAYCASKAALVMVTRVLALEWARDGIRVVAVAPGKIDTHMVAPVLEYASRHATSLNPLGRLGKGSEVAALIKFLISEDASFITGSTYAVDGGELLQTSA
jgi:NAD(P)-dependent dehydrogenase (short-subunit alcohol dehydrogenase family)